jgi:hypothetical protein
MLTELRCPVLRSTGARKVAAPGAARYEGSAGGALHVLTFLTKFAAHKRYAGTPGENKVVLAGMLGFFGTYSVNGADQVLVIRPEAGTSPTKSFLMFKGDQMIWTNRTPAIL